MPSIPGACLSALLFFPIYHGAALIHSPLGARGAEAAPRMHNSIWRQEKVTPAAQATETAHTYVMSHFVMPRHALPAPSGCAKPETKPVPMMPFFNYLRAHYNKPLVRRANSASQCQWSIGLVQSDFAVACGRPQFRANSPLGNLAIKPKARLLELRS